MTLPLLRTISGDSINRRIFRAALIVAVCTIVAKAGSTAKELVVAQSFGRSDALDAFLIAYLLRKISVRPPLFMNPWPRIRLDAGVMSVGDSEE